MTLLLGLPLFALLLWVLWGSLASGEKKGARARGRTDILESLGEGVIVVDPDLNVEFINAIGAKMIGESAQSADRSALSSKWTFSFFRTVPLPLGDVPKIGECCD